MDSSNTLTRTPPSPVARVLVVADWRVDAQAVIDACERRNRSAPAAFGLVVPAWLHGIAWAGDPSAGVPAAQRQLAAVAAAAARAGRAFDSVEVGDPEPVTAMCDALADWPADEIVICARGRRLPHPLDLAHRAARATGLPVQRVTMPAPAAWDGGSRAMGRKFSPAAQH